MGLRLANVVLHHSTCTQKLLIPEIILGQKGQTWWFLAELSWPSFDNTGGTRKRKRLSLFRSFANNNQHLPR